MLDDHAPTPAVRLFVRPGCPYCVGLQLGLRRAGLPYDEIDIWEELEAAAFVRRHANGNETVPTVQIGDVVLVNPSPSAVVAEAGRAGIALEPRPPSMPSRAAEAVRRRLRTDGTE